jgi:Domain of unknown function (DUF3786)
MPDYRNPGEDKAWELLGRMKPEDVCRAGAVTCDPRTSNYTVSSFGMDFLVSVRDRSISSASPGSGALLGKLGYFFRLSVLWYLASAKDIACGGRLVKLEQLRGGEIFTKGSHVLPLGLVADKYGKQKNAFLEKGKGLGGEPAGYGDASIRLFPLPRIPVVLALWTEDEEFPARADLFFDSTCQLHLSTDVIWSIAMMSVLIMA